MDPEGILPTEVNGERHERKYVITYVWNLKKQANITKQKQSDRYKNKQVAVRGRQEREGRNEPPG